MSKQIEAIEHLQSELASLPFRLDWIEAEFQGIVDRWIGKDGARAAVEAAFDELSSFKQVLCDDIQVAIELAVKQGLPAEALIQLIEALRGDFDSPDPKQFVFDARVELERLRAEVGPRSQGSRRQPEHEVTTWVRKNRHKYKNNAEAVRSYMELHSKGNYSKLYSDLRNDLKKNPLPKRVEND